MLKTADALVARFQTPEGRPATQPSRPYDIREYIEAVKELAVTAGKMNDLLKSSNDLLSSGEWTHRIQQVNEAADGRMAAAVGQGERLVNRVFRGIAWCNGASSLSPSCWCSFLPGLSLSKRFWTNRCTMQPSNGP